MCRKLALQNESIDEDHEHFEDIVGEVNNESITAPMKPENAIKGISGNDNLKRDDDSAPDVVDSPDIALCISDDETLYEAKDLIMGNDLSSLQESRTTPSHDKHQPSGSIMRSLLPGGYNPRHREPSHCNADHRVSCLELTLLASHVHPSVATMSRVLLSGDSIVYDGNPLNDLSLAAFLDKFTDKKPKQKLWHGVSEIEPVKKLDMHNYRIRAEISFLAEADVPPEDLAFHEQN